MPSAWNFYFIYATHYFVCAEIYMYQVNAWFGYIVGFIWMIYSNKEIFETQYLLHDIKSLFPSLDFHFRYSVVTSGQPRHVSVREQRRHDVGYEDVFSVVHSHVLNTQCQVHDIRRSSAHKHDWKSRDIIIIPWRHMSVMASHMRIAQSVLCHPEIISFGITGYHWNWNIFILMKFRHWIHRKLSKWKPPLQLVTKSVKMTSFLFQWWEKRSHRSYNARDVYSLGGYLW